MTLNETSVADYRHRYEALKAAGQTRKTLPGASPKPAPARDILWRETIPGGWYATMMIPAGGAIRIQTGTTPSSVALLAWRRDDSSERLNYADTIKVQWTATLEKGRVIFSDMGRVMLSIVEDSCGWHDSLLGGSNAATNAGRYGGTHRNTRDNFLLAAAKLGLDARDIPPCISFFSPVRTDREGRFVWHTDKVAAGDYVDLRAEMDLLVAVSNCPHPLDPAPRYDPAPVDVLGISMATANSDDLCRTATDEARRGFDNLTALSPQGKMS